MGDGLKFFSAKLHFIKNNDVVRRFCRALEGSVCLEEKIDYRGVSIPFRTSALPLPNLIDSFNVITRSTLSSRNIHDVATNGKKKENTYILFPW